MPYVGEIRIFAGNFAPKDWALCEGQLLSIAQNTALFSILGTNYGGDGKTNFALPNLSGRVPIHQGQGPGLTGRYIGESGGSAGITLTSSEMPSHNHTPVYNNGGIRKDNPAGTVWSKPGGRVPALSYAAAGASQTASMHPGAMGVAGGNMPHNNLQPFLAMNYIIALTGTFPPRS